MLVRIRPGRYLLLLRRLEVSDVQGPQERGHVGMQQGQSLPLVASPTMVVQRSAASLIDLAVESLQEGYAVKVHCGAADVAQKCNVKITINSTKATGCNFAQVWILSHLKSKVDESYVVAHTHDHISGKTVITLNFWQRRSSGNGMMSVSSNKGDDDGDDEGDDGDEPGREYQAENSSQQTTSRTHTLLS